MKNKTIKVLMLLFFLVAIGTLSSKAQRVYTFTNDGSEKSFLIKDIRSLTFPKNKVNVNFKNGEIKSIPFADLTKLTFSKTSGVNDIPKLSSLIQIYPNPVQELLHIDCRNIQTERDFHLQIISITGKTVYNQKMSKKSDINKINVSHWNKGVYFIYIKTAKNNYTKKFIKK